MKSCGFYVVLSPDRIEGQNFLPMKLTVPAFGNLSDSCFLLCGNKPSSSGIFIRSAKGYNININQQSGENIVNVNNCNNFFNYNLKFSHTLTFTSTATVKTIKNIKAGKSLSFYPVPAIGNIVNIPSTNNFKNNNLALRNAGRNILSSTTLSTASFELPSLATGVYFVPVKNKVPGEATNLRFLKI